MLVEMTFKISRWRAVRAADMVKSVQVFATEVKHLFVEHLFGIILDTEHLFGKTIEHPFATVTTT
jgi:hypothetical protein